MSKQEQENKAKVLVIGTFFPGQVIFSESAEMPENPILSKQSDERWNSRWFAGPLLGLGSFQLVGDKLKLQVGLTDFKKYVGSRDLASLRRFGASYLSNPLSTSTAIITKDNYVVVSDKSSGDAVGSIDVPGGYMHPVKDINPKTNEFDIFRGAMREVGEEVFIGKKDITTEELQETQRLITDQVCLGLSYEYAGLCHPVASFAMRTVLTSKELQERIDSMRGLPDQEIKVKIVAPHTAAVYHGVESVISLMAERYPYVEPDGRVTIALARKWLEGVEYSKSQVRSFHQI